MGLEPTTLGLLDPRSNQLSYEDNRPLFFLLGASPEPHSTLKTMVFTPAIARVFAAEIATDIHSVGFSGTMRVQIGLIGESE